MNNNHKYYVLFLCTLTFLAGCDESPEEKFLSLPEEPEQYKIVHKVDISDYRSNQFNTGLFKKADMKKTVIEFNSYGETFTRTISDGILCEKDGDNIDCSRLNYRDEYDIFQETFNKLHLRNVSITYNGTKIIIGRVCDQFIFEFDNSSIVTNYLLVNLAETEGIKSSECFDRETGLALERKFYTESFSELTGAETPTLVMGTVAIDYEETVDDDVFELPVKHDLLAYGCDEKELILVIDPFKDFKTDVDVKISESTSLELQFEDSVNKILILEHREPESMKFELCIDGLCEEHACYYWYEEEGMECMKLEEESCGEGCIYQDFCRPFSCSKLSDETECNNTRTCMWKMNYQDNGYCKVRTCYDLTSQESCESFNCTWDSKCKNKQKIGFTGTVYRLLYGIYRNMGVREATVTFTSKDGTKRTATTDSSGQYVIELPLGEYTLEVSHPEYVSYSSGSDVIILQEEKLRDADFEIIPISICGPCNRSGFTGVVHEKGQYNTRISGANVTYISEDGTVQKTVTSDLTGTYLIELPCARYKRTAVHPDHEPLEVTKGFQVLSTCEISDKRNVQMTPIIECKPCESAGFMGNVHAKRPDGTYGDKVSGVTITYKSDDGEIEESTTSDVSGSYKIELPCGKYFAAYANHPDYENYDKHFLVLRECEFRYNHIGLTLKE